MLKSFRDCRKLFGLPYQIGKAVREGRLFKMDTGVYSDTGEESELEVLQFRYPRTVVTLELAFFYYDLTDVIPERYALATPRNARPIADDRIRQYYVPAESWMRGVTEMDREGERIRIYDLERLAIETARMKDKLPLDLYKEVIGGFRRRSAEMYPANIGIYLEGMPNAERVFRIIDEEIF